MKNSKDSIYKTLIPAEEKDAGFLQQGSMVCGCALVCTDSRGARDYLVNQKTALLSKIKDPATLFRDIAGLIEEDNLRLN
jgi:hypothetical protein